MHEQHYELPGLEDEPAAELHVLPDQLRVVRGAPVHLDAGTGHVVRDLGREVLRERRIEADQRELLLELLLELRAVGVAVAGGAVHDHVERAVDCEPGRRGHHGAQQRRQELVPELRGRAPAGDHDARHARQAERGAGADGAQPASARIDPRGMTDFLGGLLAAEWALDDRDAEAQASNNLQVITTELRNQQKQLRQTNRALAAVSEEL